MRHQQQTKPTGAVNTCLPNGGIAVANTLTTNLKLTDQEEGSNNNTWGSIVDANWWRLDAVLGDLTEITTSGGQVVLTDEQEFVAAIRIEGSLVSDAEIVFSGRGGFWIVDNATSGDYVVRCKTPGGTGVIIEQGTKQVIWCDGVDIFAGVTFPDAAPEIILASQATTDVLGASTEFVAISGTNTITSFGTGPNRKRFCRATGAFTIKHNATSLICPGGHDIKAQAGDTFIVISDASSNARIHSYQRASAVPAWLPVGTVVDYAGATAPPGWLFCYGQEVSRTTYAALFNAIGTTYGSGNNVTTFNLPDCRGRVTAGKDNMGGTSANRLTNQSGGLNGNILGATGGSETHTLTVQQLPSHTHSFSGTTSSGGAHSHNFTYNLLGTGSGSSFIRVGSIGATGGNTNASTQQAGNHTHSFSGTTNNSGGGQPHNNVQPTIIFNKIIFAGVNA